MRGHGDPEHDTTAVITVDDFTAETRWPRFSGRGSPRGAQPVLLRDRAAHGTPGRAEPLRRHRARLRRCRRLADHRKHPRTPPRAGPLTGRCPCSPRGSGPRQPLPVGDRAATLVPLWAGRRSLGGRNGRPGPQRPGRRRTPFDAGRAARVHAESVPGFARLLARLTTCRSRQSALKVGSDRSGQGGRRQMALLVSDLTGVLRQTHAVAEGLRTRRGGSLRLRPTISRAVRRGLRLPGSPGAPGRGRRAIRDDR